MLISANRSQLLIVDVQERLAPAMHDLPGIVKTIGLLTAAAEAVSVPLTLSEQYPKGLGSTSAEIADMAGDAPRFEKLHFSCFGDEALRDRMSKLDRDILVIAGIEAHVCVLQTALGAMQYGLLPVVVADAVSSRTTDNHALGLARMRAAGVTIASAEMVAFEWIEKAGTPAFKSIAPLLK